MDNRSRPVIISRYPERRHSKRSRSSSESSSYSYDTSSSTSSSDDYYPHHREVNWLGGDKPRTVKASGGAQVKVATVNVVIIILLCIAAVAYVCLVTGDVLEDGDDYTDSCHVNTSSPHMVIVMVNMVMVYQFKCC